MPRSILVYIKNHFSLKRGRLWAALEVVWFSWEITDIARICCIPFLKYFAHEEILICEVWYIALQAKCTALENLFYLSFQILFSFWLQQQVDAANKKGSPDLTSVAEQMNNQYYYFTRTKGLFRTCFPKRPPRGKLRYLWLIFALNY